MWRIETNINRSAEDVEQILALAHAIYSGHVSEETTLRAQIEDQQTLISWLLSPELTEHGKKVATRLYGTIYGRTLAMMRARSMRAKATEAAPVEGAYL